MKAKELCDLAHAQKTAIEKERLEVIVPSQIKDILEKCRKAALMGKDYYRTDAYDVPYDVPYDETVKALTDLGYRVKYCYLCNHAVDVTIYFCQEKSSLFDKIKLFFKPVQKEMK